jgi:hypothetical protein
MEGTLFALEQFTDPTTITATDYMTFLEKHFGQLASVVNEYYPVALFNSNPPRSLLCHQHGHHRCRFLLSRSPRSQSHHQSWQTSLDLSQCA